MNGAQARLNEFEPDGPQATVERIQRKARQVLTADDGPRLEVDDGR